MPLELISSAPIRTKFGKFSLYVFRDSENKNHFALVRNNGSKLDDIPVRIHSSCKTGEVFCSLGCDCREQLDAALSYVGKKDAGVVIYLDQEGRGIGIEKKISAYSLQEKGYDTVEANEALGLPPDLRDYSVAADILSYFRIKNVRLMTNNPEKIRSLEKQGIKITERIPVVVSPGEHNKKYLLTKKKKLGHMIEWEDES